MNKTIIRKLEQMGYHYDSLESSTNNIRITYDLGVLFFISEDVVEEWINGVIENECIDFID